MKHLKFILPLLAVVVAISVALASQSQPQSQPQSHNVYDDPYWEYTGGPLTDPGSYIEREVAPGCTGNTAFCSLRAPKDGQGNPVIPSNIGQMVQDLIDNEQHQSQDGSIVLKNE